MEGLTLLGVDRAALKEKAPYIGAAVGALVGSLWTMFTGGRRPKFRLGMRTVVGAALGGGVGYGVKRS